MAEPRDLPGYSALVSDAVFLEGKLTPEERAETLKSLKKQADFFTGQLPLGIFITSDEVEDYISDRQYILYGLSPYEDHE